MPFIKAEHRDNPNVNIPGDRCYIEYSNMMKKWRADPRWTTVDDIACLLFPGQFARARFLAFLVFFSKTVIPYEDKKEKENGTI